MTCHCCLAVADDFGSAVLLGHIQVRYYRCPACGSVRTEEPSWLAEAYTSPIAALDVGLLSRCLYLANTTEGFVRTLSPGGRYLDWGGGYGVLTRLLRDRGLDFRHHDAYAPNYFAAGWEGDLDEAYQLITMYEVLEHLTAPFDQLARLAAAAPILLFTTQLLPHPAPRPGSWWYYALETGQHVSFYSRPSLQALAARLGLGLTSNGTNLHALYRPGSLPRRARLVLRSLRTAHLLGLVLRKVQPTPSLIEHDFRAAHQALPDIRGASWP